MASKGYNFKLSALQIQALVNLRDALGDIEEPILESIFTTAKEFWTNTVVPQEMGQITAKRGKKQPKADVPTESEIKQFELKEDEPLKEGTKQLVETMSTENSKKK